MYYMPVQLNVRWSLAVVLYISRKMFYFAFNRKKAKPSLAELFCLEIGNCSAQHRPYD